MLNLEINEYPDQEWNNRLINSKMGTFYQTKDYGLYLNKISQKPLFLQFINEKKNVVAQLLISSYSRFKKKKGLLKIASYFPISKKEFFKWVYGPVIFEEEYTSEVYRSLNKFLISKKNLVKGSTHPFSKNQLVFNNQYTVLPWCTFIIDLNQDKKKIFEKIHKHSGRKNIERAIERGIKIEEINENSLLEYNDMINEKRKLLGKEESPYDIRYDYWKTMKQIGYIGLIAKKKNVPVGALFFNHFNKYIIESGLVRSDLDYEEKLYSQDLIKWKIIEWGIDNKMNWYDFAGANPNPSNSKEEGILRYKRKWGGKQYDYMLIQNYN